MVSKLAEPGSCGFLSTPTAHGHLFRFSICLCIWHCQVKVERHCRAPRSFSAGSIRYKARSLGLPSTPASVARPGAPASAAPPGSLAIPELELTMTSLRFGQEHLQGVNPYATAWRLRRDFRHTQWTLCSDRTSRPESLPEHTLTRTVYDPEAPMLEEFQKAGWTFRDRVSPPEITSGGQGTARGSAPSSSEQRTYRDLVASGVLAYD